MVTAHEKVEIFIQKTAKTQESNTFFYLQEKL